MSFCKVSAFVTGKGNEESLGKLSLKGSSLNGLIESCLLHLMDLLRHLRGRTCPSTKLAMISVKGAEGRNSWLVHKVTLLH